MEIDRESFVRFGQVARTLGESAVGGLLEVGRTIKKPFEEFVIAVGGVEVDELQKRQ